MKKKLFILSSLLIIVVSIVATSVLVLVNRKAPKEFVYEETAYDGEAHEHVALDTFNSKYGAYFEVVDVEYVDSFVGEQARHVYELSGTDMQVDLVVRKDGSYGVSPITNKYGSDYGCVYFETEADHLSVYNYLYEYGSGSVYVIKPDLTIIDLDTQEVLNYGEHAGRTGTGDK